MEKIYCIVKTNITKQQHINSNWQRGRDKMTRDEKILSDSQEKKLKQNYVKIITLFLAIVLTTMTFISVVGFESQSNETEVQRRDPKFIKKPIEEPPDHWIEINTLEELRDIKDNLTGNYYLGNDIDASQTETWNQLRDAGSWEPNTEYKENDYIEYNGDNYYLTQEKFTSGDTFDSDEWWRTDELNPGDALGWKPIGHTEEPQPPKGDFEGNFDGQGHVISNLYINRGEELDIGLFGRANAADIEGNVVIQNVGLEDVEFYLGGSGDDRRPVGGLIGRAYHDVVIKNTYSTGTIESHGRFTGGLIGFHASTAEVIDSYSECTVIGHHTDTGGLIGRCPGHVIRCYATGDVTSSGNRVGGLVGHLYQGNVPEERAIIEDSYSIGTIQGDERVGGLVGELDNAKIEHSYSTTEVSGNDGLGGLIGKSSNNENEVNEIFYSYSNEDINPDLDLIGRIVGNGDTITTGSQLRTTDQMTDYENDYPNAYEGWDLNSTWRDYALTTDQEDNYGYPALQWENIMTYDLNINIEGEGKVEVNPDKEDYKNGENVILYATPAESWMFHEWTGDVPEDEEGEEIKIMMNSDKEITAHFEDFKENDGILGSTSDLLLLAATILLLITVIGIVLHKKKGQ